MGGRLAARRSLNVRGSLTEVGWGNEHAADGGHVEAWSWETIHQDMETAFPTTWREERVLSGSASECANVTPAGKSTPRE